MYKSKNMYPKKICMFFLAIVEEKTHHKLKTENNLYLQAWEKKAVKENMIWEIP